MSRRGLANGRTLIKRLRQPADSRVLLNISSAELTAILTASGATGMSVQLWIRTQLAKACWDAVERSPSPFLFRATPRVTGHA